MRHHVVVCFAIGSILVTGIFFYDIILFNKTLLSTGVTPGVMGDDTAYNYLKTVEQPVGGIGPTFSAFHKDLGAFPWQVEPHNLKNLESISKLTWPLWNDSNAAGKPQAANFISTPFFPLKLITYLLPNSAGWDMYLLLRFALGLFFMALFLRQMKLRAGPSFLGGVMFAFSGYFVLYQNITDMDVGLLTPVIFWVAAYTMSLARSANIRWWQYLCAVGALVSLLLANVPEPLLLVGAAGGVFWFCLLIQAFRSHKPYFYRALKLSLQVAVPALLFVLPQYLLNFELVQNSISLAHGADSGAGVMTYLPQYILFYVFPYIHVTPYWLPLKPSSAQVMSYLGLGTFFLVVLGSVSSCFTKRKFGLWMLLLLVGCLGKMYGAPIINHLIGELPGFNRVWFPKYIQPLICFSATCLAAYGLHSLLSKIIPKKVLWVTLVALAGLVGIGLQFLYPAVDGMWVEKFGEMLKQNVKFLVLHLGVISILIWLILRTTKQHLRMVLVTLLGLVVTAELWVMLPRHYPTRYDSFTPAPYVTWLQSQPKPFRIFGFDRLLFPELASGVQLDDIRALDVLYLKPYYLYIKNFISPGINDRFIGTAEGENELAPVQYLNNPWFDLLNVKYIFSKTIPLELLPENKIFQAIFEANQPSPSLRISAFVQNGDARLVFFEHPPNTACVSLPINTEQPWLKFSTALDSEVWEVPGSDGVEFVIQDDAGKTLFDFIQNPAEVKTDQKWMEHAVDLSQYAGGNADLCLITRERTNSLADYAGWGDLRLKSKDDNSPTPLNEQYTMVYDGRVEIYENLHVYPRGFLVGVTTVVENDEAAVIAMKVPDYNPRQAAVITQPADESGTLDQWTFPNLDGQVCQGEITDYYRPNPSLIRMKINSPGRCLLVFSESNYPGWLARVDGEVQPIYQTDLLLRGVVVEPGEHSVEFAYRPHLFYWGLLGSVLGVLLAAYWSRKITKQARSESAS